MYSERDENVEQAIRDLANEPSFKNGKVDPQWTMRCVRLVLEVRSLQARVNHLESLTEPGDFCAQDTSIL
jgi:hypothetical protein